MSWQFNITENGTTTLATAGKYCDRNIDINVDVAGEIGGAYNITTTVNDDGTQSLDIVDAESGGSEPVLGQLDVGENGQYMPSYPYVGFNVVNVEVTPTIETVTITVTDEAFDTAMSGMNVIYVNGQGTFGYATVVIGGTLQLNVMKDTFVAFENASMIESSWPNNWLFVDRSVWCVSDGQTYTRTA